MRLRARYIILTSIVVIAILLVALCQWFTWTDDYFEQRGLCYTRLIDIRARDFEGVSDQLYNAFPNEK